MKSNTVPIEKGTETQDVQQRRGQVGQSNTVPIEKGTETYSTWNKRRRNIVKATPSPSRRGLKHEADAILLAERRGKQHRPHREGD